MKPEKETIGIGTAIGFYVLLMIGKGYDKTSTLDRNDLVHKLSDALNNFGEIEIDKEVYKLIEKTVL